MKKLFVKVDKQGCFLADELITNLTTIKDEEGNLLSQYIDPEKKSIPPGLHLPKIQDGEWVEGKEIDLDEEKLKVVEKVKNITKQRIVNGIDFKGHFFFIARISGTTKFKYNF